MAKTQWPTSAPYGNLTPALMESYWGVDANTGHDHKGLDADGSCPKINIADSISGFGTGSFDGTVSSTYFTVPVTDTFYYQKIGNVITLLIPEFIGGHGTNQEIQIAPVGGNWPSEIIPTNAQDKIVEVQSSGTPIKKRSGKIVIPNSTSTNLICYVEKVDVGSAFLDMVSDEFGTGNYKGILRQSISYYVD